MSTLFVVDIDATIADASRRYLEAGPEPKRSNKDEYSAWVNRVQNAESLKADPPLPGMRDLVTALAEHSPVVYLTAREEQWREVTMDWLVKHEFPIVPLHMRQPNDWSSSGVFKAKLIDEWKDGYSSLVVIDDDPGGDIEAECRARGIMLLKSRLGGY